jgi:hypothetical protein
MSSPGQHFGGGRFWRTIPPGAADSGKAEEIPEEEDEEEEE